MEVEVMIPSSPALDFNFDSASTSPYISAPSSPQRFGTFFYSAPTSPTRVSAFYQDFHGAAAAGSLSAVPFNWEEKPGIPKTHINSSATSSNYGDAEQELEETDFAFDFSGHLERTSLPADELFDGGKIKPLKPRRDFSTIKTSPSIRLNRRNPLRKSSEKLSRRETDRKTISILSRPPWSKHAEKVFDKMPTRTEEEKEQAIHQLELKTRDLYPLTGSASESRAKDKEHEQLKKYTLLKKNRPDDVKNSSFRSTDSMGSVSSRRKSGPPISAHELHYTVNRQLSEEMKKRTYLPYKQGLLGCLGFHPTVPEMSKGISPTGSLSRG
ncbi:hypothetical protein DH2020_006690 [Rehmannia glutinosa]|uniref:Uncharacterized protein n=1 Tax=Rehmannia glutinosa TaxID=99300 RepID=A0ABR0XK59_REHGL